MLVCWCWYDAGPSLFHAACCVGRSTDSTSWLMVLVLAGGLKRISKDPKSEACPSTVTYILVSFPPNHLHIGYEKGGWMAAGRPRAGHWPLATGHCPILPDADTDKRTQTMHGRRKVTIT